MHRGYCVRSYDDIGEVVWPLLIFAGLFHASPARNRGSETMSIATWYCQLSGRLLYHCDKTEERTSKAWSTRSPA